MHALEKYIDEVDSYATAMTVAMRSLVTNTAKMKEVNKKIQ